MFGEREAGKKEEMHALCILRFHINFGLGVRFISSSFTSPFHGHVLFKQRNFVAFSCNSLCLGSLHAEIRNNKISDDESQYEC